MTLVIPTRYIGTGNIEVAKTLTGLGRKLLGDLRRDMGFQSLPTGRSLVRYPDGTTIECIANHGLSEVRIHVPSGGHPGVELDRRCFCFPHFSFGIIKTVKPDAPTAEFLRSGRFLYDVEICAKTRYILFEDVVDANFGRYHRQQYVLVTIGAEMEGWANPLDCQRNCLLESPRFDVLTISPVHIKGQMRIWQSITEIKKRKR